MQLTSFLVSIVALGSFPIQPKRYLNPDTGLMFDYPSTWTSVITKTNAKFTIQLPNSGKIGTLEAFAISFRESAERFQELQRQINKDLRREITRQWQEELLGVPVLMTQVDFATEGQSFSSITALVYSATPRKLNFRLTAPAAGFDEALGQYRQLLQSVRTISGADISTEDPSAPPPEKTTKPPTQPPDPPKVLPADSGKAGRRGEIQVAMSAAGKDLTLFVPKGWTVEQSDAGIVLSRDRLLGTVQVSVFSTLDSPIALRKMNLESGKTIEEFSSIAKREDSTEKRNGAGALVTSARRIGVDGQGKELVVWHAVGASGDYYWLLTYRIKDKKQFGRERGIIEDLMDRLSVTGPK